MRIDKTKLNTLLRSGLNPEIKTRKQLAAHLALDPTSLTRWFATRDRLGNPRYPVVPDRHVTKILKLFNLTAETLSFTEEEFRQHCFDLSLQNTKHQDDIAEKSALRLAQVTKRTLAIENYSSKRSNKKPLMIAATLIFFGLVWLIFNLNNLAHWFAPVTSSKTTSNDNKCWTGFASSLGDYSQDDEADPCHYSKLLHNALAELKAENNRPTRVESSADFGASQNYITFLSEQLDQRRISNKITLNIELGKRALRNNNYLAAELYFHTASKILLYSNKENRQLSAEISAYQSKIKAALN
ncbi:hypothetical protein [Colwellia piezophila]|uniref:hypothetical protein n=1 Tax=Colwellia piezophila TaxID=211668 RepID=UPI00036750EA|nr:hypothetical protein [Colwellia piezophila]